MCSELQLASEVFGAAYKFNSNFYTRDLSDFSKTLVYIGEDNKDFTISARNCYLRNENTNANIYVTSATDKPKHKQILASSIVVLECFSITCTVTALYRFAIVTDEYKRNETYCKPTFTYKYNRPKLSSSINMGL